jgi:hypothetical protein
MARAISTANQAALEKRALVARDFLWLQVRDRVTGAAVTDGMWSDFGTVTANVVNPDTGAEESRTWAGAGSLVKISDIPLVSNLTVQTVTVQLSQVSDHVNDLIRGYDPKQGRIEIYRGLFDPASRAMTAAAECRFVGFVDEVEVKTPREGEEGAVVLTCTSHTQEMTRSNPDTRSDASQRLRSATDDFFADVAVTADWEHFWGAVNGKLDVAKPAKPAATAATSVGGGINR